MRKRGGNGRSRRRRGGSGRHRGGTSALTAQLYRAAPALALAAMLSRKRGGFMKMGSRRSRRSRRRSRGSRRSKR